MVDEELLREQRRYSESIAGMMEKVLEEPWLRRLYRSVNHALYDFEHHMGSENGWEEEISREIMESLTDPDKMFLFRVLEPGITVKEVSENSDAGLEDIAKLESLGLVEKTGSRLYTNYFYGENGPATYRFVKQLERSFLGEAKDAALDKPEDIPEQEEQGFEEPEERPDPAPGSESRRELQKRKKLRKKTDREDEEAGESIDPDHEFRHLEPLNGHKKELQDIDRALEENPDEDLEELLEDYPAEYTEVGTNFNGDGWITDGPYLVDDRFVGEEVLYFPEDAGFKNNMQHVKPAAKIKEE
ncbi:MAG: hypothetical protein SVS85_00420 [Candidatus Nanohaloarchaea archaeon]|nr:hypothetical protein [Candidatus Nanohaloarchaea archaeon]